MLTGQESVGGVKREVTHPEYFLGRTLTVACGLFSSVVFIFSLMVCFSFLPSHV